MTKLYELNRGDRFILKEITQAPPDIGEYAKDTVLTLFKIDGMYSRCVDDNHRVYHPVAWALVEKVESED